MKIDSATVVMELVESEPTIEGYYNERPDGRFHICIANRTLDDLQAFVGTAAHELAHIHLLGHRRLAQDTADHELVTDLLPIFFGMGIFGANSVIYEKNSRFANFETWQTGKRGYMSMAMHSYALAKLAYARNEVAPKWAKLLRPDVRAEMRRFNSVLFGNSAITDDPVETDLDGETIPPPQELEEEQEDIAPEQVGIDAEDLLARYAAGERDFRGYSLHASKIIGGEFPGCDFTDCDFSLANCDGVNFSDCNFTGANFREAGLVNAVILRCDLKESIFTMANLNGADLADSDLSDADFRGAQLVGTKIIGTRRTIATDFRFADISHLVCDGNIADEVKKTERYVEGDSELGVRAHRFVFTLIIAMLFGSLVAGLIHQFRLTTSAGQIVGIFTFVLIVIVRSRRRI
jgi:uncharacterized protein YjbI with pentapeptide repeats